MKQSRKNLTRILKNSLEGMSIESKTILKIYQN
jgi:hypothetical protein